MNLDILPMLNNLVATLPGGDVIWMALMFIVVLSILVYVHEWGHYRAALSVGVHVETFSIGFGREIFGWYDKSGTRWKVSIVPLGGYVKMYGDEGVSDVSADKQSQAFLNKKVWQRMWVVVAGPLANFVFAFVALSALMMAGEEKLLPKVGEVMSDMPAAEAGLQPGDLIKSIGGEKVGKWEDLQQLISSRAGDDVPFVIERDGAEITLTVSPQYSEFTDMLGEKKRLGRIGVLPSYETFSIAHGPLEAIKLGAQQTYDYTATTIVAIWRMINRTIPADQVGGPLMIAEMAGKSAEHGTYHLVLFMVIISINLGLINLFPIPMLDGGHLVYYTIEAIKGSPVGERAQEVGYRFGLLVVGMLMAFAFYNDISRIVTRVVEGG